MLNTVTGSIEIPTRKITPILTPEQRLEKMKKKAHEPQKRKAVLIPPPESDPTIRKKHRLEHSSIVSTKPKPRVETQANTTNTGSSADIEEIINLDISNNSIASTKTSNSANRSNVSINSTNNANSEVKEEESFTDILKKDLDITIEDGEIQEQPNTSTIIRPRTSTPKLPEKDPSTKDQTPEPEDKEPKIPRYDPEPAQDYPSYDPRVSTCQKYVPTSEILFDLYTMVRKANQNVGLAMRHAMIREKLLISKSTK